MYANGKGVLKDLSKAKYWIKKAYEGGDSKAKKTWNVHNAYLLLNVCTQSTNIFIFLESTSGVMSCPKLKTGFVSPLN
jgi:TPR repeat protein